MSTHTAMHQIIEYGIDRLEDFKGQNIESADLHHHLYNEDYFIIGTYDAEQFLEEYGTFRAINEVQEYEKDQFGEATTGIDPEKIANMLAYIKGEQALQDCPSMQTSKFWDKKLTDDNLDQIATELKAQL